MIETLHGTGVSCGKFIYYLKRHIELDAGEHAVWAEELLCRLCNDHSEHVQEAREAAVRVLGARLRLWDGVLESIRRGDREESGSPPATWEIVSTVCRFCRALHSGGRMRLNPVAIHATDGAHQR